MSSKPFAFVVMPFSQEFDDVYKLGIKPACQEAGYYCERLDEQIFEETMLDRIYNQISKADLIVADLTGRNPNVFYETGYAHALEKRVILLTRDVDDIPFDLKHYTHIIYSSGISALKQQLKDRSAYFLKNSDATSTNPFEQIDLIVNKTIIKPHDTRATIQVNKAWQGPGLNTEIVLNIDVGLHLSILSPFDELNIQLRLITDNRFAECGRQYGNSISQIHNSIYMPNQKIMHKPLNSIQLSKGDPDKVVFDLCEAYGSLDPINMTLRLLCNGFMREIDIFVISQE